MNIDPPICPNCETSERVEFYAEHPEGETAWRCTSYKCVQRDPGLGWDGGEMLRGRFFRTKSEETATPNEADQYRDGKNGCFNYKAPTRWSYTSIPVLQELWGRPWDDRALDFVHALRPSGIRISGGAIQNNAQNWRVTVYVKADGKTIDRISQEVEVGTRSFENGHEASIYYRDK